jgi:hypothetical protein
VPQILTAFGWFLIPVCVESELKLRFSRHLHALPAAMSDETTLSPGCEILLLEDDAPFRRRLAVNLRRRGAEVTEAGRIDEARRLLRDVRFEFALVDLHLPDGNVLDLLREGVWGAMMIGQREWCVGPALVAGPQSIGETARRSSVAKPVEDRPSGGPASGIVPAEIRSRPGMRSSAQACSGDKRNPI